MFHSLCRAIVLLFVHSPIPPILNQASKKFERKKMVSLFNGKSWTHLAAKFAGFKLGEKLWQHVSRWKRNFERAAMISTTASINKFGALYFGWKVFHYRWKRNTGSWAVRLPAPLRWGFPTAVLQIPRARPANQMDKPRLFPCAWNTIFMRERQRRKASWRNLRQRNDCSDLRQKKWILLHTANGKENVHGDQWLRWRSLFWMEKSGIT